MKKILSTFAIILLIFTLVGCGGGNSAPSQSTASSSPPPPPPANRKPIVALPNADPTATRGIGFSYDAAQGGRTFTDPDNDSLTYSIRFNSEDTRGLTVDGATVSGTPTSFGSVNMTVIATDPDGETAADNFSIVIGTQPEVRVENRDQTTRIGAPFNYDAAQNNTTFIDEDRDVLSYDVIFSPSGQGLTANNGVISGTASIFGPITVTITATDDDGFEATDSFEILVLPREKEQIFVTQEPDKINVFVKGSVESSNKYLRYQFERHNKAASRAVGWGWRLLNEATQKNDENFIIGSRLLNEGENFVAIREVGKSDFMGGSNHGDQIDSSFTLYVDGKESPIDGLTKYIGETIEFRQVSTLYEVDNPILNETANVQTDFKITYDVNTLRNRIEFLRPIELSTTLLAMLSADRHENGDSDNKLLISEARWSPEFTPFDVSQAGHGAPATMADTIRLSGPSGYFYEVKMTKGWERDRRRSIVNDGDTNNKLYFSPIGTYPSAGPGLSLPVGHVIEVEAEYKLDTTN